MDGIANGSAFMAVLTTRGRVTGRAHSRPLRAVAHGGRIYFSRRRPDSDWFKNAVADPHVSVRIGDAEYAGTAERVTDEGRVRIISEIKYPGQKRAGDRRVAVQVTLCGPPW